MSRYPNITDLDIIDRMALVEGKAWAVDQRTTATNEYSVNHYLVAYHSMQKRLSEMSEDDRAYYGRQNILAGCGAIYGSGGWHRYFVRHDGEVIFSDRHGTRENVDKAVAVGFRTCADF